MNTWLMAIEEPALVDLLSEMKLERHYCHLRKGKNILLVHILCQIKSIVLNTCVLTVSNLAKRLGAINSCMHS